MGVSGGCEAAVHATREFLEAMPDGVVIAKLDFCNAFNTIRRSWVLQAVHSRVPAINKYCCLAYRSPSQLRYGGYMVMSREGVQQGVPLGPLLFCLTIHPVLTSLNSEFKIGYLNDILIGGETVTMSNDVSYLISISEEIGLELNVNKCELIS